MVLRHDDKHPFYRICRWFFDYVEFQILGDLCNYQVVAIVLVREVSNNWGSVY